MGSVVSTTVANRSDKKIWVKYDFQETNVKMEKFAFQGTLEAAGIGAGAGVEKTTVYNWKVIKTEFQPIDGGQYKPFDIPSKFNDVVYLSIITEDDEIICNAMPKKINKNVVITGSLQYRFGIKDKSTPFAIDEKYPY